MTDVEIAQDRMAAYYRKAHIAGIDHERARTTLASEIAKPRTIPSGTTVYDFAWEALMPELHPIPKIVCLCGSTRFKDAFTEANFALTLRGYIVLQPGVWLHDPFSGSISDTTKERLDALHFKKIDLADEVFVVNPINYIGESTDREIKYALKRGKAIRFLDPAGEIGYRA